MPVNVRFTRNHIQDQFDAAGSQPGSSVTTYAAAAKAVSLRLKDAIAAIDRGELRCSDLPPMRVFQLGQHCAKEVRATSQQQADRDDLTAKVLRWSLAHIRNDTAYEHEVKPIPDTFSNYESYKAAFLPAVIEELRAELAGALAGIGEVFISQRMSIATVLGRNPPLRIWLSPDAQAVEGAEGSDPASMEVLSLKTHDLLILSSLPLEEEHDLGRVEVPWCLAAVTKTEHEGHRQRCEATAVVEPGSSQEQMLCAPPAHPSGSSVVYSTVLTSLVTSLRIYNALEKGWVVNARVAQEVLCNAAPAIQTLPPLTPALDRHGVAAFCQSFGLNASQTQVVMQSAANNITQASGLQLVQGPPGEWSMLIV
eukprot:jgi/Chlat1/7490/Chrsp60S09143